MRVSHSLITLPLLAFSSAWGAPSEGPGLLAPWVQADRWQGRVTLGSRLAPVWRTAVSPADAPRTESLAAMGDYYFSSWLRQSGSGLSGFRATGGVMVGSSGAMWAAPDLGAGRTGLTLKRRAMQGDTSSSTGGGLSFADAGATPYIGIGYTGVYAKSGWGFSADLGIAGIGASGGNGLRLDRSGYDNQGIDSLVHRIRLAPVLQLGVSYLF